MCTTMAHDVCNENHECIIRGTQRGERDIYHNKLVTKHKYYSFNKKNYKAKRVLEYKYRFTRVYSKGITTDLIFVTGSFLINLTFSTFPST